MTGRVLALLRARLRSQGSDAVFPAMTIATHAMAAAALCALLRGALPPYAYAVCALTASAALAAIPLLGELGYLLRADPAAAWVGALPVRPVELKLARTLHLLVALGVLVLAALVPAALLAPPDAGLALRLALPLEGLAQAAALAAALLLLQSLLGGRVESLLVLAQTFVVVLVVVGLVAGVGAAGALSEVHALGDAPGLAALPGAWIALPHAAGAGAAAVLAPLGVGAAALLVLALAPAPRLRAGRRRASPLERLLAPARALATRVWLRAGERGPFDLVYDALPREREVVIRTVPMIGIPLAFLVLGVLGGDPSNAAEAWKREGLLVLVLFTPGIYLPILLAQVPISETPRASHLLETAPVSAGALANGALKALAVRFVLPLYVVLTAFAASLEGVLFALRFALPGALLSLLVLRLFWGRIVQDPPLSRAPDEVRAEFDLGGALFAAAFALAILAALAAAFVEGLVAGVVAAGVLLALELALDARWSRGPTRTGA